MGDLSESDSQYRASHAKTRRKIQKINLPAVGWDGRSTT